MSLIANAADRLLGAIVPRATAAAWSCASGWYRVTCGCAPGTDGGCVWFDECCQDNGPLCDGICLSTVWTCHCG
jgi:hypothetical protein